MSDVPSDHPLQAWLAATRGGTPGDTGSAPATASDPGPPVAAGAVSKRLLVLTGAVCVTAVLLGVVASPRAGQPAPATAPDRGGVAAPVVLPTVPGSPASSTLAPTLGATAPADPATAAAAIIAVRTAAPSDLYVDTAVVDTVTVADGLTLVGVRSVVVPRIAGRWGEPVTARYVVPIGPVDGIPTALADPWRVPFEAPAVPEPALIPAPGAAAKAAVSAALTSAGYAQVADLRLSQSQAIPDVVVAALRAIAPGESTPRVHRLWLGGEPLQVLGAPTTVDLPVPQEEP